MPFAKRTLDRLQDVLEDLVSQAFESKEEDCASDLWHEMELRGAEQHLEEVLSWFTESP